MRSQPSSVTSSSGCMTWPATPPALFTRQKIACPASFSTSSIHLAAALRSARSTTRVRMPRWLAVCARFAAEMSHACTVAPRSAKLCAMVRPSPCPAPLTTTSLPSKRIFIGGSAPANCHRSWRACPARPRGSWRRVFRVVGQATPWRAPISTIGAICTSTSVRRLRMARSRQTPECVFALGRLNSTIFATQAFAASGAAFGMNGVGIEAVEALRLHALGQRHLDRLAAERAPDRQQFRAGQAIGDALLAKRLREQHRAVAELAPQIAPDVSVVMAFGSKSVISVCSSCSRGVMRAVQLAQHDGAAAAEHDLAGGNPVGAVVDEGADGAVAADDRLRSASRSVRSGTKRRSRSAQGAASARAWHRRCDAPSPRG